MTINEWLEIAITVDGEAAEAVSEVFNRYNGEHGGAVTTLTGFHELDAPQMPTVTVSTVLPCDGSEDALRQKIEEALWHLSNISPLPKPQIQRLAEVDWANAWKARFHAFRVTPRIQVAPSWEPMEPESGEIVITLDPGMAFGTGLHPSTRLCLRALEAHLRPGDHVLDLGTGSGILSIAAAKLGAASVLALDVDPVAVTSAQENAQRNDVNRVVIVGLGSLAEAQARREDGFDLVLVNILAEVIIRLLDKGLAGIARPGGLFAFSGILSSREADLLEMMRGEGLIPVERQQEDDWVALVARRSTSLSNAHRS